MKVNRKLAMAVFDDRVITSKHILAAIKEISLEDNKYRPARSSFLIYNGAKYPAKTILRLAYRKATGGLPRPDQLTGGKASLMVLEKLGFKTKYSKPAYNKRTIKSLRRQMLYNLLQKKWGVVLKEHQFETVVIPDLTNPSALPKSLQKVLSAIEQTRHRKIVGKCGRKLRFDFYVPKAKTLIEFDEKQHFTAPRAAALRAYPGSISVGYSKAEWINRCIEINAGDNDPIYRDEQRAFYDTIRDFSVKRLGIRPLIRIYEYAVPWEKGLVDPSVKIAWRQLVKQITHEE